MDKELKLKLRDCLDRMNNEMARFALSMSSEIIFMGGLLELYSSPAHDELIRTIADMNKDSARLARIFEGELNDILGVNISAKIEPQDIALQIKEREVPPSTIDDAFEGDQEHDLNWVKFDKPLLYVEPLGKVRIPCPMDGCSCSMDVDVTALNGVIEIFCDECGVVFHVKRERRKFGIYQDYYYSFVPKAESKDERETSS